MKELIQKLKISIDTSNQDWVEAHNKAVNEPEVPFFISKEFVNKINDEYGVLQKNYHLLISAVDEVKKNLHLCLLSKILYHLLFLNKPVKEIFKNFILPTTNQANLAYDLFSVFPILAHIPLSWQKLKERGVDDKVNKDTHSQLDNCISEDSESAKRPYFSTEYFLCYRAFIYSNTLRVERLRFEIASNTDYNAYIFANKQGELKALMHEVELHKSGNVLGNLGCLDTKGSYFAKVIEKDDCFEGYCVDKNTYLAQNTLTKLDKNEYKLVYKTGDAILKIHIPFSGTFDKESVERSLEKARKVFANCYSEYNFKGFMTHTWFLAPVLDKIIKIDSNIYNFRKNFLIFPSKNNALSVLTYVFGKNVSSINEVDFETLQANNSLQKGVKEYMQKGEYVYEFNGYIKF